MSVNKPDKQKFVQIIDGLISEGQTFKITFSKQKERNKEIVNVYLKTAVIKKQLQYSLTNRYRTRDEVKNYTNVQIADAIDNLLGNMFFNAVLFYDDEEVTLLQNKKGNSSMIIKKVSQKVVLNSAHDQQKNRLIPEKQTWLQKLGLAGKDGTILDKSQDKFRQINKFVEIIDHMIKDYPMDQIISIGDMGSGKGYLTFALYDHLVNNKKMRCKLTGYEMRQDIVSLCYKTAIEEGFVGLTFQQKDIDQVSATGLDMVIALHACDIATDMAIAKGINANAKYIVTSPCCHKQVRNSMKHNNVLSPILSHGILEERQAEILTDGIRALIMEANGYKTQVFEFISAEHTSKNLMIIGVKSSTPDLTALEKVNAIKTLFGIEYHHLERLLYPSM